jgi:hypothetical protein
VTHYFQNGPYLVVAIVDGVPSIMLNCDAPARRHPRTTDAQAIAIACAYLKSPRVTADARRLVETSPRARAVVAHDDGRYTVTPWNDCDVTGRLTKVLARLDMAPTRDQARVMHDA